MPGDIAVTATLYSPASAYAFGVLSSFTPCVYPLIPVTIALFGGGAKTTRGRSFFLSLCYVLGMSVTYTILGMISVRTGQLFGSFTNHWLVVTVVAALLGVLFLSTLDLLNLSIISRLQTSANKIGGRGAGGAFLMGTASGLVAAPCVGPALVVLLGFAARSGDIATGALLLFSYSLGLGTLFLLLGTFSNLLTKIPRSGPWLNGVKYLMASSVAFAILVVLQARLTLPHIEGLLLLLALFCGAGLGALGYLWNRSLPRCIGAAVLGLALFSIAIPSLPKETGAVASVSAPLEWKTSLPELFASAKQKGAVVMIDFWAEWCVACKELEAHTFSHRDVQPVLRKLALGKVDLTEDSPEGVALSRKYRVLGLPSVLFLDADGVEIEGSRITGFVDHKEFLDHVEKIQG